MQSSNLCVPSHNTFGTDPTFYRTRSVGNTTLKLQPRECLNEIHGKNRQEESGFKETGQVKENSRQGQDEEVNQSFHGLT
jgi:hypothetical protein